MPTKEQRRPGPKADPAFRKEWGAKKWREREDAEARSREQVRAMMKQYPNYREALKPFLEKKLTNKKRRELKTLMAAMPPSLRNLMLERFGGKGWDALKRTNLADFRNAAAGKPSVDGLNLLSLADVAKATGRIPRVADTPTQDRDRKTP